MNREEIEHGLLFSYHQDDECWYETDPLSAIHNEDLDPARHGDFVTVYCGEPRDVSIIQLLPDLFDYITERAYDLIGESSENWRPDVKELEYKFHHLAKQLFPKIPFYTVENIKAEQWMVTEVDADGRITDIESVAL